MKTINEMSDKEVLSLTDEDIQKLILLAYAENGIKLLQHPTAPSKKEYEGDLDMYKVDDVYYKTYPEAEAHSECLKKCFTLRYSTPYSIEPSNEYKSRIEKVKCFSPELADRVSEDYRQDKVLMESYEKDKLDYDSNFGAGEGIRGEILDKARHAHRYYDNLNYRRADYKQYLQLSDGNDDIATRFLIKAFPELTNWEVEYIKDETQEEVFKIEDKEKKTYVNQDCYDKGRG